MISGIRHYHYSTRNLSITPEQSTRLARVRTSSGVLEHLHVFALSSYSNWSRLELMVCSCALAGDVLSAWAG